VDKDAIKEEIQRAVIERIEFLDECNDDEFKNLIQTITLAVTENKKLSINEKIKLSTDVFNAMRKYDIVQPYIEDPTISEIMINGYEEVFIERGGMMVKEDVAFVDKVRLENLIQKIVSKVNRTVNEASPIVDARLDDGSRVNIVLPPVSLKGPIVTIRKFTDHKLKLKDMVDIGTINYEIFRFLKRLVEERVNIFICGGTSSGKTTFLNALSEYIDEDERVITIEDSAELRIRSVKNLISLETRNPNIDGKGAVTIAHLIRTSLRMRPDRIIIGEVRGGETFDMLQAMNTGHDGSFSTGHGNSCGDMMNRLEMMVLMGVEIPIEAIRKQIASAIDIVIHLKRYRDHSRRVSEISKVSGIEKNQVLLTPLFRFVEYGDGHDERIQGKFVRLSEYSK